MNFTSLSLGVPRSTGSMKQEIDRKEIGKLYFRTHNPIITSNLKAIGPIPVVLIKYVEKYRFLSNKTDIVK
jgi:hypothetical protein